MKQTTHAQRASCATRFAQVETRLQTAQASVSKIRKHVHAHPRELAVAVDGQTVFYIRGMRFLASTQNASKRLQLSVRQC